MPDTAGLPARFAATLDRLGLWEPSPLVAVAASGGADSTALTLLADRWARARGGRVVALIVDHGLRPDSPWEAGVTAHRLAARGIASRILRLRGLARGPGLLERARAARYRALVEACAAIGALHLLIGHHAADQAETLMLRVLGGSLDHGLAGMPLLAEGHGLRLLRPLLAEPPGLLRAYLRAEGMAWVEDPSNADPRTRRARLRHWPADPAALQHLANAARVAGATRSDAEARTAEELAERVTLWPEGFALVTPGPLGAAALAAVIRTVGGRSYPPPPAPTAMLARALRPATLAGVRILSAGRLGPGWLLTREGRGLAPPVPARAGALWDQRFRLLDDTPAGVTLGALGGAAAGLRRMSPLPAAVLVALPALWSGNVLAAVPHLDYRAPAVGWVARVAFHPPVPLAGAPFAPS